MGFICHAPILIPIAAKDRVVVSGFVQAASQMEAIVTGPGVSYRKSGTGVIGVQLETLTYTASGHGFLAAQFPITTGTVQAIVSHARCEVGANIYVETYTIAVDAHDTPSPDNDYNDLLLTIQIIKRQG